MRTPRRLFGWLITGCLLLLLLTQLLGNGPFAPAAVAFAASPQNTPGHLTFQQFLQLSKQYTHTGHFVRPRNAVPLPLPKDEQNLQVHMLPGAEPPTMQPIRQPLTNAFLTAASGTAPLDLHSSDHRLEVWVIPGSLDLSHASVAGSASSGQPAHPGHRPAPGATPTVPPSPAASPTATATPGTTPTTSSSATPTPAPSATPAATPSPSPTPQPTPAPVSGPFTLVVTELHGHSAGESNMLGQYQIQILDAQDQPLTGVVLRQPITIIYHYQRWELTALDLDPGKLSLIWNDPGATKQQAAQDIIPMRNDTVAQTLTAQTMVLRPGPFDAGSGDPQNQSPPIPHLAEVQGNGGQISYSYPIQVAPAPDGFVPQLALSYSSSETNERHSYNSPANDVGDGWGLSLGSITAESYPSSSSGGAATWFFINGVDNVSDRLIQDTTITSGTFFQTEHVSHLRIQEVNPTSKTPCFHVWDESGTYYEFGCTQDSLQYRKDSDGTLHNYRWDVNSITAPNEGQSSTLKEIQISYLQECGSQSGNCPSGASSGTTSIRDAGIRQITYGAGVDGQQMTVAGTVDFSYLAPETITISGTTWATKYGTNYNCTSEPPQDTTLRCDDPLDYGGGQPAPTVMSVLTLQKVVSYVTSDQVNGDADYEYDFTYQDSPFTSSGFGGGQCNDPTTNPPKPEYCAGEHLLTKITPIAYQGVTSGQPPTLHSVPHTLKPVLFTYTPLTNTYADHSNPLPGGAPYVLKVTWQYLSDYLDTTSGVGGHIVYATAYNNTNGTPANHGDDRTDPTYCFLYPSDCTGIYQYPDGDAWTEQVVTKTTSIGSDSSQLAPATTTYSYRLEQTNNSGCNGVCVGDNWIPTQNAHDQDWADFYHGEFKGFQEVYTISPANDLTVDTYFATEGWFSPESNAGNYNSGQLSEEDVYTGANADDNTLLRRTTILYTGAHDNNSCEGLLNPIYVPCLAMAESSTTTYFEGTGSNNGNAPSVTTAYTYDDYDPVKGLTTIGAYHNLLEEQITSSNAPTIKKFWSYAPNDSGYNASGWIYYDVNKVAHNEIDDTGSPIRKWQCQSFSYDEIPGGTPPEPTPAAGLVTTTNAYSSANCTSGAPMITTYNGYDAYGNPVAAVDGVATANASFYGSGGITGKNGCTLSTAPVNMSNVWGKTNYTTCTVYDVSNAQPAIVANAFGQTIQTQYDYHQGGLPIQVTDANGMVTTTSYSYDANSATNGKVTTSVSQPGEQGSFTTQSNTNSSCPTSGLSSSTSLLPCFEIDKVSAQYPTALEQTFYDAQGREIETSAPTAMPAGGNASQSYYTIQFTEYDDAAHTVLKTFPIIYAGSAGGAGWLDPKTVLDYQGKAPTGTMTFDDALNRPIAVDDARFNPQKGISGINCPSLGGNATSCTVYLLDQVNGGKNDSLYYDAAQAIDPNDHVSETFVDALGNTRYMQVDSGLATGTLTPAKVTSVQYNVLNEPTNVTVTDEQPQSGETTTSVTTTMQYDDLGRLITLADPDRGTHNYTYDNDGHVISDVSGSRTLGYNDDLLGRLGCEETAAPTANATGACSAGSPLVQNTYDVSAPGVTWTGSDYPTGRLTQSIATSYFPDGTQASTTESMQYDERGRVITQQMSLGVPTSWGLTTALPAYQLAQAYNDANQPTTTQTTTIANGQQTPGYIFTQNYDSTTGVLVGLSNNSGGTPNLAALSYNENALADTLTFSTSAGSNSTLATEQFTYDGDLRPKTDTAAWGSGSGASGQIFSEQRWYDSTGNVKSQSLTYAAVPGQAGSGGSETENFCYDEQNRLVWASNTATPSPTSAETCGNQTPGNSLNGASYTSSYVYTNLGQLWQGPLSGGTTEYQYLYCNSAPHQLSGLYAVNSTCSSKSGQGYKSIYDSWGNVTSRTLSGTSVALAYDSLDRLVKWSQGSGVNDYFAYDTAGNRTIQRASNGTTTLTVYAFGLEEYQYSGTGTLQNATHYYTLGGKLLGALTGLSSPSTIFFLTDALGNLLATFNNTAGAAALVGNQVYGPYGTRLYHTGQMDTAKGYTGQYADTLTGLDYYGARYYDPAVGVFLSADSKQGNAQGMNPYAYVGGNPETMTDPSGQYFAPPGGNPGDPNPPAPTCETLGTCPGGNGGSGSGGSGGGGGMGNSGGGLGTGGGGNDGQHDIKLQREVPTCDTTCQEEQTYNVAQSARDYFYGVADRLNLPGILGVVFGAIGFAILKLFGTAIFGGIMGALATLSAIATEVGNGFKQETDQVDLRNGQGLSYFNFNNILRAGNQITGNLLTHGVEYVAGAYGAAIVSLLIAVFAPDPEPLSKGTIMTIGVGLALGLFTYGTIVGMGTAILYGQAQNYIDQEISHAPCTDSVCNLPLNYP